MTDTAAAEASQSLLDLAHGKYADEVALADQLLTALAPVAPWAAVVKQAMDALVMINKVTAPLQVISDGAGGYVSTTNSRYDPKTGRFL